MSSAERPPVLPRRCTVIEASRGVRWGSLREVWGSRDLLMLLAWRDIRVRYRQTALGVTWAVAEPLASVLLFTLIFHRLAGFGSGEVPYVLHCFPAMLIWTFFSRALRGSTVSLVANAGLLTKAYFPRCILPLASTCTALLDLVCALAAYAALALYFRVAPGLALLTLPLWVLLAGVNALGLGLLLGAWNARMRDVSAGLPLLLQLWMLVTPIAYPIAVVPSAWRPVLQLNPMTGIVEGMRWACLPGYGLDVPLLGTSVALGLGVSLVGVYAFLRAERGLADIL